MTRETTRETGNGTDLAAAVAALTAEAAQLRARVDAPHKELAALDEPTKAVSAAQRQSPSRRGRRLP